MKELAMLTLICLTLCFCVAQMRGCQEAETAHFQDLLHQGR